MQRTELYHKAGPASLKNVTVTKTSLVVRKEEEFQKESRRKILAVGMEEHVNPSELTHSG